MEPLRSAWHRVEALAPVEAEIGGPHWVFRQRYYDFLADGRIVAAVVRDGIRTAVLIADGKITPLGIGQVQDCPRPLGEGLAYIATPPAAPPSICLSPKVNGGTPFVVRAAAPAVLPQETISPGEPITFLTRGGTGHAPWYPPNRDSTAAPESRRRSLSCRTAGRPACRRTAFLEHPLVDEPWLWRRDVNYGGSNGHGRAYRERLCGQWASSMSRIAPPPRTILSTRARRCRPPRHSRRQRWGLHHACRADVFEIVEAGAGSRLRRSHAARQGTDKSESRYLVALIGPCPSTSALSRASPVHDIHRLTCPVIFFQGGDDKTVPPNQAQTMVEAMAARGLPVAYYSFAGEGHGFRKAETLRRVLELELDFYGRVFGFTAPGVSERVEIANLPALEG